VTPTPTAPRREAPRARARRQTIADITRIGREHLTRDGAASLSLRAVARDLGVVSSAVYRYLASRDDLLTLLVVDAYDELGDAVDAAVDAALALAPDAVDAPTRGFHALGLAVRTWALREPSRYALLFGTPVPGYAAPAEQTVEPGTRVVVRLVRLVQQAHDAGTLAAVSEAPLGKAFGDDAARIRDQLGLSVTDEVVARGLLVWSALFGAVSWEVFGQYGDGTVSDPGGLLEHHLAVLASTVGLPT
jgi:AcrR family transcriptional regulator